MNSNIKSFMFTILGVIIFFAVAYFFISLIPYLLIAGLVIYMVVKIKRNFGNRGSRGSRNSNSYNTYSANLNSEEAFTREEDIYQGKVIDVDYKEVDE